MGKKFFGLTFTLCLVQLAAAQDSEFLGPPPSAQVGKCYTQVLIPATYKTVSVKEMTGQASFKSVMVPAEYDWTYKTVVVREEDEHVEMVPATYKTVLKKIKIADEQIQRVEVPAAYRSVTKRVQIEPAKKVWKKGRGALEKVDGQSGEIYCLTEQPAVYANLEEKVLVKSASVREVIIPAKYRSTPEQVIDQPSRARIVHTPAVTKTVPVRELVSPAYEKQVPVPATYRLVTKQIVERPERHEWRSVLCETNVTQDLISRLQRSLMEEGYYLGSQDGVYNEDTQKAVASYQRAKELAVGGLTEETLQSLEVTY